MKVKESKFFIDPTNAKSAKGLADLACIAIEVMSYIYESGGKISEDKLPKPPRSLSQSDQKIYSILKKIMLREAKTKHFDTRSMGQIHPQGNKIAILSEMIAAFMNNNTIVEEVSSQENILEREVTERLAKWFGYDKDRFSGNIVTGGTTANIAALWIAREKAIAKYGHNTKLYILASKMKHYSIIKASEILGNTIEFVPLPVVNFKTDVIEARRIAQDLSTKGNGRIMAIVGIAGETETGLIEDLSGLSKIAKGCNAHFHVDAAYGGPFILSKIASKFAGIELADSITIDPHKMLFVPYEAGAILFKDKTDQMHIENGMKENARYILKLDEMVRQAASKGKSSHSSIRNYGMTRLEGSMGSGGVIATWTTLELMGEKGIASILNNLISLTNSTYKRVSKSEFLRPLFIPETNTLLIGLRKNQFHSKNYHKIIREMQASADKEGFYISVNEEVDENDPALRMVIMHPHTTIDDVLALIDVIENVAKKLSKSTI